MRERVATIAPIAAVAGGAGLCCGMPVLLSLGAGVGIAGWSLQSWALIGLGVVLAAAGWTRWARGRRHDRTCHRPGRGAPLDTAPGQSAESTATEISTDATVKGNTL